MHEYSLCYQPCPIPWDWPPAEGAESSGGILGAGTTSSLGDVGCAGAGGLGPLGGGSSGGAHGGGGGGGGGGGDGTSNPYPSGNFSSIHVGRGDPIFDVLVESPSMEVQYLPHDDA